jgi:CubicO group peptidase (beta-lactamase class C family)
LTFTPGKAHAYSNSGYFLLAEIIARVSEKSLNEFASEHIFKPLSMNSTQFYDDHTRLIKHRAMGYSPTETGFRLEHFKLDVVGDGALHTTVEDLFLWDQNFYSNKLMGGQAFVDTLLTPGTLTSGKSTGYAFGLGITTYRGQRLVTHAGGWAGYISEFWRFPEQKFSIIILSNRGDYAFPKAPSIAKLFLKDVLEPDDLKSSKPPASEPEKILFQIPDEELEHYTGTYENTSLKVQYTITVHDNHLVISFPYNSSSLTLEPTEKDVFDGLGVRHEFKRDKEKRVKGLRLITEQVKPLRFKKIA